MSATARDVARWMLAMAASVAVSALSVRASAQTPPSDDAVLLAPVRVSGRGRRHPGRSVAFGGIAPGLLGYGIMAFVTGMTSIDPICAQTGGGYVPVIGPLVGMIASRDCPNYAAVFAPDFVSLVLQAVAVPMIIGGVIEELRSRRQRTAWMIIPANTAGSIGLSLAWTSR